MAHLVPCHFRILLCSEPVTLFICENQLLEKISLIILLELAPLWSKEFCSEVGVWPEAGSVQDFRALGHFCTSGSKLCRDKIFVYGEAGPVMCLGVVFFIPSLFGVSWLHFESRKNRQHLPHLLLERLQGSSGRLCCYPASFHFVPVSKEHTHQIFLGCYHILPQSQFAQITHIRPFSCCILLAF